MFSVHALRYANSNGNTILLRSPSYYRDNRHSTTISPSHFRDFRLITTVTVILSTARPGNREVFMPQPVLVAKHCHDLARRGSFRIISTLDADART